MRGAHLSMESLILLYTTAALNPKRFNLVGRAIKLLVAVVTQTLLCGMNGGLGEGREGQDYLSVCSLDRPCSAETEKGRRLLELNQYCFSPRYVLCYWDSNQADASYCFLNAALSGIQTNMHFCFHNGWLLRSALWMRANAVLAQFTGSSKCQSIVVNFLDSLFYFNTIYILSVFLCYWD